MTEKEMKNNLNYLGLTRLCDEYPSFLETAVKKKIPISDFFEQIISTEVENKQNRSVSRKIKMAHFPARKTLETFDWTFPKEINEDLVRFLFHLDFVEKKGNVVFLGPTGVGKTHLMIALGIHACKKGYTVLFDTAADIINRLSAAQAAGRITSALKAYRRPDILCVDEIGYLPIDQMEANLFFQIISELKQRRRICFLRKTHSVRIPVHPVNSSRPVTESSRCRDPRHSWKSKTHGEPVRCSAMANTERPHITNVVTREARAYINVG